MYLFVVALHVILCVFLILIIILQPGKGGDIGAAFGGGSSGSTVFGPRGPAGLLQRATTVVAVLFMCTSVTLALYSNQKMLSNANVGTALEELQKEEAEKAVEDAIPVGEPPAGTPMVAPAPDASAPEGSSSGGDNE